MKQATIVTLVMWVLIVVTISCARADNVGDFNDFMGDQVYSVYLERANYIHEADSGRAEYNAEKDKSLGIQIDVLCQARGRTPKQCWYQMLFSTGNEYTPYKGQF